MQGTSRTWQQVLASQTPLVQGILSAYVIGSEPRGQANSLQVGTQHSDLEHTGDVQVIVDALGLSAQLLQPLKPSQVAVVCSMQCTLACYLNGDECRQELPKVGFEFGPSRRLERSEYAFGTSRARQIVANCHAGFVITSKRKKRLDINSYAQTHIHAISTTQGVAVMCRSSLSKFTTRHLLHSTQGWCTLRPCRRLASTNPSAQCHMSSQTCWCT